MPHLVVVIPALNEEASIGGVIAGIPRTRLAGAGITTEVVVVDDGSQDATEAVARAAGAEHVVAHGRNRGLGAAVRTGLRHAYQLGADVAVLIDADGEYPPAFIPEVIEPILAGRADYVLASRFLGHIDGMVPARRLGNRGFTLLQSLLLRRRITDGQTGMRAFSRPALRDLRIIHDYNYAQVMTLNLLRQGYRLEEVPIPYRVRSTGRSFIRYGEYVRRVLPAMVRELLLPPGAPAPGAPGPAEGTRPAAPEPREELPA